MTVIHGDCREVMAGMDAESVDAVVTDPPYELGFMGKKWDSTGIATTPATWEACWRVLKPGGYLLAFGGSRTFHRIAVAIEDAGFEIRDTLSWLYGCLSDDTEVLINGRWEPYHKATPGSIALCYNSEEDTYSWLPIQETFRYDISDTAYRIQSDSTDQVVSRNHRCLVERNGTYVFERAENLARQHEARVPVLENMRDLLSDLCLPEQSASDTKQDLFEGMFFSGDQPGNDGRQACRTTYGNVRNVWKSIRDSTCISSSSFLQSLMQWQGTSTALSAIFGEHERSRTQGQEVRRRKSVMERGRDLFSQTWQLQADQIRTLPRRVFGDESQGWLRHGTPASSGTGVGAFLAPIGSRASRRSRSDEQRDRQLDAIRIQSRPQTVRASRYTRSDLARITPIQYDGVVWCIRVPTGAFVVRRNGKVFVTGNSGFPKSLDVSKAIDKAAGAEREVVGVSPHSSNRKADMGFHGGAAGEGTRTITAPATPEAEQWAGWGTALKPAWEPIIMARKPLAEKTVAKNVLAYGTGALNIDACRIEHQTINGGNLADNHHLRTHINGGNGGHIISHETERRVVTPHPQGRWPANVVLDEVAAEMLDEMSGERKSGGASRYFKVVQSDQACLLCLRTYAPKHEIMNVTQEVTECDHANTAAMSSSPRESDSDSVLDHAQVRQLPISEGSNQSSNGRVGNVENSSGNTKQTPTPFAAENVLASLKEKLARRVSDAGNLCGTCATAIAQSLVSRSAKNEPSPVGLDTISESKRRILIQSLALLAERLESIDTIPTTADLSLWFGYVQHAISESTTMARSDTFAESAPLRLKYTAKASRAERNAGLAGMPEQLSGDVQQFMTRTSSDWIEDSRSPNGGYKMSPAKSAANYHPTVKPISLMRWLIRMVTPANGTVLDPFAGSGTTGVAAILEGFSVTLIEQEAEYIPIIEARMKHAQSKARQITIDTTHTA